MAKQGPEHYWKVPAKCWNTLFFPSQRAGRMSRWRVVIGVGPPMGRASTPGKRNPVRQVQGQLELRSLFCLTPGTDQAWDTKSGQRCGDPSEIYFLWVSKPKGISGGPCSSDWRTSPALFLRATLTFTAPDSSAVTLESQSTRPDSCSGGSTLGPNDTSSAPTSSPCASLSPGLLHPLCQLPADEEDNLVVPQGARTPDSKPELGARDPAGAWALSTMEEQEEGEEEEEEECPICTEPYGPDEHYPALLNCGHSLCVGCLHQLLGMTPRADLGRVCCPLCRQKTPMLEWEICQLQEELLRADGPQRPVPTASTTPLRPGPGPWASLEHRYQLRFLTGPVGGRSCFPFLPCPPSLGTWLWTLRERGPCARRLSLLSLLALELLGLVLIFMPLMLLGVLFMLLDGSGH